MPLIDSWKIPTVRTVSIMHNMVVRIFFLLEEIYLQAKVEKILAEANEKMNERVASASKKAAEMKTAAELVRNQQATKIAVRAELMRKAGLLSPSKTSFKCCFRVLRG